MFFLFNWTRYLKAYYVAELDNWLTIIFLTSQYLKKQYSTVNFQLLLDHLGRPVCSLKQKVEFDIQRNTRPLSPYEKFPWKKIEKKMKTVDVFWKPDNQIEKHEKY